MIKSEWEEKWRSTASKIQRFGGKVSSLKIDPPAAEEQIQAIEKKLKFELPVEFRKVIKDFSASVDIWYSIKWGDLFKGVTSIPDEVQDNLFSGALHWDLSRLVEFRKRQLRWYRVYPFKGLRS